MRARRVAFVAPDEGRAAIYFADRPVYQLQHDSKEPIRSCEDSMRMWMGNAHLEVKMVLEHYPFPRLHAQLKAEYAMHLAFDRVMACIRPATTEHKEQEHLAALEHDLQIPGVKDFVVRQLRNHDLPKDVYFDDLPTNGVIGELVSIIKEITGREHSAIPRT